VTNHGALSVEMVSDGTNFSMASLVEHTVQKAKCLDVVVSLEGTFSYACYVLDVNVDFLLV